MKIKHLFPISLLLFLLLAVCVSAQLNTYVVPAISDAKILPASTISDSYSGGNLSAQVCPGEYKALSFVIRSDSEINGLNISCSDLTGLSGTIQSSAVDLKWVKCWWQGGYGNNLYLTGRYLTGELLLNDDSMIKTTCDSSATSDISNSNGTNSLKLQTGSYIDISNDSQKMDARYDISISDRPIQDAQTLQSINLSANYNKQMWLTIHVPNGTPPGNYVGEIYLKSGSTILKKLNINIYVLPFSLSQTPIEHSLYYSGVIGDFSLLSVKYKNTQQYTSEIHDMQSHGVTDPTFYSIGYSDAGLTDMLSIRQSAGMDNSNLYHVVPAGSSANASFLSYYKTLTSPYGVLNWYEYGPDETDINDTIHRDFIESIHNSGGKYFNSQTTSRANAVADILDTAIVYGSLDSKLAAKYHSYGHKVFSYANPQTVPEYPRIFRQNYGLSLWQADYDGAMDFAYMGAFGDPWNDFNSTTYRDHMLAYPTANGVIDTIQWEGFREGVNDLRYLATLQNIITSAKLAGKDTTDAENYLQNLKNADLSRVDLDNVRIQIIDYTLSLESETSNINMLNISNGRGSGLYQPNEKITITASSPNKDYIFSNWDGDTQYISNVSSPSSIVTMPSRSISIKAVYRLPWADAGSDYKKRIAIDINHNQVGYTNISDFPVVVNITNPDLRTVANGGYIQETHGYDMIFTSSDGTKLNYEVKSYNNTTGQLIAFIRVPTVSYISDTALQLYFDNSEISTSMQNVSGVWDDHFMGVWHLGETASGNAGDYKDSTKYSNSNINPNNEPTVTTGKIGQSQYFDGSSNYLEMNNGASLNLTAGMTIDAIIKRNGSQIPYAKILDTHGSVNKGYYFQMGTDNSSAAFVLYDDLGSSHSSSTIYLDDNDYVYITATFDGNNIGMYKNGIGTLAGLHANLSGTPNQFMIGKRVSDQFFKGGVEEVTVSNISRSDTWIQSRYNNVFSPDTFYAIGDTEYRSGANYTYILNQTTKTVNFFNVGNNYTSVSWNFGDGFTSNVNNPTHIYSMNGTYTVIQTVSDGISSNTSTKTIYINSVLKNAYSGTGKINLTIANSGTTLLPKRINALITSLTINNTITSIDFSKQIGTPGTIKVHDPDNISLFDVYKNNSSTMYDARDMRDRGQLVVDKPNGKITEEIIISNNNKSNIPTVLDYGTSTSGWSAGTATSMAFSTSGGCLNATGKASSDTYLLKKTVSLNLSNAKIITINVASNISGSLYFRLQDSAGKVFRYSLSSRYPITANNITTYIFPLLAPAGTIGSNPVTRDIGFNLSSISEIRVGVGAVPNNANVVFSVYNISTDVPKSTCVEIAVPDTLASPISAKLECWNGSSYNTIRTSGLQNGVFTNVSLDVTKLNLLDNTTFSNVGTTSTIYPQGSSGDTVTGSDGSTVNYLSNINGSSSKIGIGIDLPPSDNGRTDFNKVRLRCTIYGNPLDTTYNLDSSHLIPLKYTSNDSLVFIPSIGDTLSTSALRFNIPGSESVTWNTIADNPLTLPYGSTDVDSINTSIPSEATVNGVLIKNVSLVISPTIKIGYSENASLMSEKAENGKYILNLSFTPSMNYEAGGVLKYSTATDALRKANYIGTPAITSDHDTPSVLYNQSSGEFNVTCGALVAGDPLYNLSMDDVYVDFSADNTTPAALSNIQFTDLSNQPTDTWYTNLIIPNYVSWYWDFDDDGIIDSNDQNPVYNYKESGNFSVGLTVKNVLGNFRTLKSNYINVSKAKPAADFNYLPTKNTPQDLSFISSATGGAPYTYLWDFGDGATSTDANPTHSYVVNVPHTVTLRVSNDIGNNTTSKTVSVGSNSMTSLNSGWLTLIGLIAIVIIVMFYWVSRQMLNGQINMKSGVEFGMAAGLLLIVLLIFTLMLSKLVS